MADDRHKDPPDGDSSEPEDATDRARRRLLRIGAYSAPAIIGSMLVSREALAQTSCGPITCGPDVDPCGPTGDCLPDGGSCGPDVCLPNWCAPDDPCGPNN